MGHVKAKMYIQIAGKLSALFHNKAYKTLLNLFN